MRFPSRLLGPRPLLTRSRPARAGSLRAPARARRPGARPRPFTPTLLAATTAALAAGLLLIVVSRPDPPPPPPPAIELVAGVPVSARDTPAGALAAADNYVALSSQSLEQDPAQFAALVAQTYTPSAGATALSQAQRIRAADATDMANYREGGRGVAIVAARRLDRYTPREAQITTWLGGVVWGPRLAPRQTWNLVETTLRWRANRWLVVSSRPDATPAPVPSIVYVQGGNDHAAAFARLSGMSAPFYGTAE